MKPRVLIVDDEPAFAHGLAERLEVRGYDVSTSLSGEDAVDKVAHYLFDVVILDVALPGMGGMEVLKEIKRLKPLTEVIMLTGHATVETAIQGMKSGAYDYLTKPYELDDLVTKIERARARKQATEEEHRAAKVQDAFSSPRSILEE